LLYIIRPKTNGSFRLRLTSEIGKGDISYRILAQVSLHDVGPCRPLTNLSKQTRVSTYPSSSRVTCIICTKGKTDGKLLGISYPIYSQLSSASTNSKHLQN